MNANRAVVIDRWTNKDGKRTGRYGVGMTSQPTVPRGPRPEPSQPAGHVGAWAQRAIRRSRRADGPGTSATMDRQGTATTAPTHFPQPATHRRRHPRALFVIDRARVAGRPDNYSDAG